MPDQKNVAFCPAGAIEQHGAQLPVATDLISANWMSRLVAEKLEMFNVSCIGGVDESQFPDTQKGMIHADEMEISMVPAHNETLVDPPYRAQGQSGRIYPARRKGR